MNKVVIPDHFTEAGARKLAARIREYWEARGLKVQTTAASASVGDGTFWFVRSDMVNGHPRPVAR